MLEDGDIALRLLRLRDRNDWAVTKAINKDWLKPWTATSPVPEEAITYAEMIKIHKRESQAGRSHNLGIWFKGELVGEITLGGIYYGAYRGAHIAYWISQTHANQGIVTQAVTMLTDYAFNELNLHRIEIVLCTDNTRSKRVAEKAGYTFEGVRPRYIHVDGRWQDHLVFVKENPNI